MSQEKHLDEFSLSRRSLVAGAAAGAAAAAIGIQAAGAAPGGIRGNAPAALRAQGTANLPTPRNETVVVEQSPTNTWDSFNPFIPNGEAYNYGLAQFCREYMFYTNFLTGEVTPWLATEYSYNADFTECTLKLNPAVTWSDGQPFTADDVVFTDLMVKNNQALVGSDGRNRDIVDVVAVDPQTVTWTLTRPQPRFHYRFLAGIIADGLRVMPKHIWESQDPGTFKFNPPIQTGPYVLQESSSSKLYYLWKKSENYWNKANLDPKPNYVMYVQATSVDTSVQDFLAGNTDVPSLDFLNQEMVASQTDKVARFAFADPCPRGFYFNCESPSGLFSTPEGRWAMSHLIDREVIASTIWQPASRAATFPWADYDGWTPWATPEIMAKYDMTFNVDKANEMLDALGATRDGDTRQLNGKPLQLTMITPAQTTGLEYQIAVSFAETAKQAGIDIQVKSLPGAAFGDAYAIGDYDMTCHWVCGMQFDPNQLYGGFHSRNHQPMGQRIDEGGDQGKARLQDPEFDAIIEVLDDVNPDEAMNPTAAGAAASPVAGASPVAKIDVRAEFDKGLDRFMTLLPCVPSIQTTYPVMYGTTYWTGWPTDDNPFAIPTNWWGQFLFAVAALQPSGQ
jgi:peptide/nickel transport system substrate-binding protein